MLRHRRRAVALAIAHGDAVGAGGVEVDVVGAGGRYQDQLEVRAGRQGFGVQGNLVADDYLDALQARNHIRRRGIRVQLQVAEAVCASG